VLSSFRVSNAPRRAVDFIKMDIEGAEAVDYQA
jgi:hypothetical protein